MILVTTATDVLFETWERHIGSPAPVTDTVRQVTGRPPRSMAEWAAQCGN